MSLTSREFEADVLGGLMLSSLHGTSLIGELAGILGDDAFTCVENREIYAAMQRLAHNNAPHDGIAVAEAMKGSNIAFADIVGLQSNTSTLVNIEHRARHLRELANRRTVIEACREAMAAIQNETASNTIGGLTKRLDAVLSTGVADAMSFREVIDRAEQQIELLVDARKTGKDLGVPFGIPAIDLFTGGMRPGELIGIAARTSIGKTALANQIAVHAGSHGHRGLIMTLEESPEEIGFRAISNKGSIHLTKMRSGAIDLQTVSDVTIQNMMRDYPLWVDTKTYDLTGITGRITQYVRKHRIAFVVVDHISLVQVPATGGKKRYEALGEVTRTLKLLAGQLGIAIVALVQVGRESEKESRRPMLSDLRESGNIEQDLNTCIALHPKCQPDIHGKVLLEIGLIKNRYGARCWLNEPLEFRGAVQQFLQIENQP